MHATLSHFVRTVAVLAALPLLPGVAVSQTTNPLPNTNGQPGFWLPAVDHGDHLVGCAGGFNSTRFIPIHGCLIPKGNFRGCVLVWEKGNQPECMLSGTSLSGSDVDMRWAIFDPRVNPPVVHKFAWRVRIVDAPTPPCQAGAPPGYQGAFCSGHCWLPDGRLLVAGGDYWVFAQAACSFAAGNSGYAGSRFLADL